MRVVVGIPAHDEAESLPSCLTAVLAAGRHAVHRGVARHVHVVVAAHRCTDDTAQVASALLPEDGSGSPGDGVLPDAVPVTGEVLLDRTSSCVGQVRNGALFAGLRRLGVPSGEPATWLFSTDADTVVPRDWITRGLQAAQRPGDAAQPQGQAAQPQGDAAQPQATRGVAAPAPVAVAGLVDLANWNATPMQRQAYEAQVARGLFPGGHWHAYGATLAVRSDVFAALGGFPHRAVGEDVGLVSALRQAGFAVATPTDWRVTTSARSPGRAEGGLGDLLGRLGD